MAYVELRVHGVSGTPPEDILDIDRVRQVAGDEFGRHFTRADRLGRELVEPGDRTLEAYHWGRLTSGSTLQGLWLLLAPFGLVNAAQFMLEPPESRGQRGAHHVAGAMLRLIGLTLTAVFVLAAAVITIDLWTWQREQATNGLAFVLAMLGPLVLLGAYVVLARPAIKEVVAALDSRMPIVAPGKRRSDLVRPGFLEGKPGGSRALRRLHIAAGLALVGVLGFAPGAVGTDAFGLAGFRVMLVLLGLVAAAVVVLGDPQRSASTNWQPRPATARFYTIARHTATGFVMAAAAGVITAMVHLGSAPQPTPPRDRHFPGIDWASYLVMAVALFALVVLVAANGILAFLRRRTAARRDHRAFAPYGRGMACTLAATLGVFLGVGYVGAFTTVLAKAMTTELQPVLVPELLARVVYAWGITTIGILLLVGVAFFRKWRSRRLLSGYAREDLTRRDHDGTELLRVPERWIGKIAAAIWAARLKNSVVCVFTTFAVLAGVLSGVVLWELGLQLLVPPSSWPRLAGEWAEAGWLSWLSASPTRPLGLEGNLAVARDALIALGTAALTGLATALFFLGRTALFGESARRGVNVVWDVISFWPRSAHPFVPAAYSQRAVPDLEDRIRTHLHRTEAEKPAGRVVLCGHSQGSLLSFTALLRLAAVDTDGQVLDRVGLLTFGSQLQVMFSRGFPAYVNYDAIQDLHRQLGQRWINLYRDTDPLAGPVLSWGHRKTPDDLRWIGKTGDAGPKAVGAPGKDGPDREENGPDWRLVDPPVPTCSDLQQAVLLPLRKHSDYWLDPTWNDAVHTLSGPGPRYPRPRRSAPNAVHETTSERQDAHGE